TANPIDPAQPFESLADYVRRKLGAYDGQDPVLTSLQEGYRHDSDWPSFFAKIVEDRADSPSWQQLDETARARWLAHQLFAKLPSPGASTASGGRPRSSSPTSPESSGSSPPGAPTAGGSAASCSSPRRPRPPRAGRTASSTKGTW